MRQVTNTELISWRMALKLGMDSAMKVRTSITLLRNTIRFPLPVAGRLNAEDVLKELVGRIQEHWVGGDQMDQHQYLHGKLNGAVTEDADNARK